MEFSINAYKTILVAVDFSDINQAAIERTKILAKQNDCQLILLHVIEHFPFDSPLGSAIPENISPDHKLAQSARAKLDRLVSEFQLENVQQEVSITTKSARKEILRFATAHNVDLIVVAPHGRGMFGALGSTAIGVLNGATCDVLTVREPQKRV
jgi:universal stress protein A